MTRLLWATLVFVLVLILAIYGLAVFAAAVIGLVAGAVISHHLDG